MKKKTSENKTLDIKEFVELGWLQEINRQILHPSGMALVASVDENDNWQLAGVIDERDDPEGIIYPDTGKESFVQKALWVKEAQAKTKDARLNALGYIVQPLAPEEDSMRTHPRVNAHSKSYTGHVTALLEGDEVGVYLSASNLDSKEPPISLASHYDLSNKALAFIDNGGLDVTIQLYEDLTVDICIGNTTTRLSSTHSHDKKLVFYVIKMLSKEYDHELLFGVWRNGGVYLTTAGKEACLYVDPSTDLGSRLIDAMIQSGGDLRMEARRGEGVIIINYAFDQVKHPAMAVTKNNEYFAPLEKMLIEQRS